MHGKMKTGRDGDTTFYFVTDGIESSLKQVQKAAAGKDIRLSGDDH